MAWLGGLFGRLHKATPLGDSERRRLRVSIETLLRETGGKNAGVHLAAFFKRYDEALATRGDEREFLAGELEALTKLAEKKEASPMVRKGAKVDTPAFDAIADSIQERISSYPRLAIGGGASEEMERLAGALARFHQSYLPLLSSAAKALRDRDVQRRVEEKIALMRPFAEGLSGRIPKSWEEYRAKIADLAGRSDERAADELVRRGQPFIKEVFLILKGTRVAAQDLRRLREAEQVQIEAKGRKVSAGAACVAVIQEVNDLMKNFRMRGLDG